MLKKLTDNLKLKITQREHDLFFECIGDLISNESVLSMNNFYQHGGATCLEHCVYVSYVSFRIAKRFKLDYKAAARGGLLHDLFLYDWRQKREDKSLHAFSHPKTALKNANELFVLNNKEKDIILKHMWPVTIKPPSYFESYIISFADKYCAMFEMLKFRRRKRPKELKQNI